MEEVEGEVKLELELVDTTGEELVEAKLVEDDEAEVKVEGIIVVVVWVIKSIVEIKVVTITVGTSIVVVNVPEVTLVPEAVLQHACQHIV